MAVRKSNTGTGKYTDGTQILINPKTFRNNIITAGLRDITHTAEVYRNVSPADFTILREVGYSCPLPAVNTNDTTRCRYAFAVQLFYDGSMMTMT
jgi:hypothetical protein